MEGFKGLAFRGYFKGLQAMNIFWTRVQGWGLMSGYLEGQEDLVRRLITPITH